MSKKYGVNGQIYLGTGVSPLVEPSPEVFELRAKAKEAEVDEPKPIKINWEDVDGKSN